MSIKYGKEGVRQRNYRVYMTDGSSDIGDISANYIAMLNHLALFEYPEAYASLESILSEMVAIGEIRKDSLNVEVSDNNSVECNESGKIVISKSGTFSCELINSTVDNVDYVTALDGTRQIILLYELTNRQARMPLDANNGVQAVINDCREIIVIGNPLNTGDYGKLISVSEKDTGGGIMAITLKAEDSVSNASGFRTIKDVAFSTQLIQNGDVIISGSPSNEKITFTCELTVIHDGIFVDVATDNKFSNLVAGYNNQYFPKNSTYLITGLLPKTDYFIRAFGALNGQYVTSSSNVLSATTAAL